MPRTLGSLGRRVDVPFKLYSPGRQETELPTHVFILLVANATPSGYVHHVIVKAAAVCVVIGIVREGCLNLDLRICPRRATAYHFVVTRETISTGSRESEFTICSAFLAARIRASLERLAFKLPNPAVCPSRRGLNVHSVSGAAV